MSQGRQRGDRASRPTHYGNPIEEVAMTTKKNAKKTTATKATTTKYPNYTSTASKFAPVSDETTPYGAKKFRTPYAKDEFAGLKGSPIPAYVFDIDGTLQGWGSGADKDVLAWAEKLYKADEHAVFLVVTARDHGGFGYTSSFNWLMQNFPYPFIGPFARATDDPRYASEFKRELAQGFEDMGLYQILGAADDNKQVIDMWKQWAIDHFEDPKDFNLLECSYQGYGSWRKGLAYKGGSSYGYAGYTESHKGEHYNTALKAWESDFRDGQRWVPGHWDAATKKWVEGFWEADASAKHRPAGSSRYEASLAEDPAWKAYFAQRDAAGAYVGADHSVVDAELVDDDPFDAPDWTELRLELEDIVAHQDPELTPAQISDLSINDLRERTGIIGGSDEDYRGALVAEINRVFGEWRYTLEELAMCTLDELEQMLEMDTAAADRLIDGQYGASDLDEEVADPEHIGSKKHRLDVEDEVWAAYEDLTMEEISGLDIVVLQRLLDAATDAPKGVKLFYRGAGESTGPLDVAEVLAEVEGRSWDLGGRTYLARGGQLVEITAEVTGDLPQQSPRYEVDPTSMTG